MNNNLKIIKTIKLLQEILKYFNRLYINELLQIIHYLVKQMKMHNCLVIQGPLDKFDKELDFILFDF